MTAEGLKALYETELRYEAGNLSLGSEEVTPKLLKKSGLSAYVLRLPRSVPNLGLLHCCPGA